MAAAVAVAYADLAEGVAEGVVVAVVVGVVVAGAVPRRPACCHLWVASEGAGGAWTEVAAERVAWARATSARAGEAGVAGPMLAAAGAAGGRCGAAQAGSAEGLALRREQMEWAGEGVWGPTEQRSGDGVAGEPASCHRPCKRTSGRLRAGGR